MQNSILYPVRRFPTSYKTQFFAFFAAFVKSIIPLEGLGVMDTEFYYRDKNNRLHLSYTFLDVNTFLNQQREGSVPLSILTVSLKISSNSAGLTSSFFPASSKKGRRSG